MAYSHSFSPEFYSGDNDFTRARKPKTVRQALFCMPRKAWRAMVRDVFPCVRVDFVDVDMVMEKITETDTVGDLRSPVDVWIDPEGYHTVLVY